MQKIEQVEWLSPDDLIPYEMNAKTHPAEQVRHIANSIKNFGWTQPIVVDENNVVVIGHGRLMAAKELMLDKVPVVRRDDLTEDQVNACRLADNKTNESPWDFGKLEEELAALDIAGFDMGQFGFEVGEDFIDHSQDIIEDEAPEVQEEAVAKLGQIYQLGRHRLMCGDSTSRDDVEKLMDGQRADMVMTDPPYGIKANKMTMGTGAKEFYRGEEWDEERPDISLAFTIADNICVWGGNYFCDVLPISNDWLVWHKKNDGLSFSECELAWSNFGCNTRHLSHHWGNEKKLHVTMKPLQVIVWAMGMAKEKAKTVVDLFGGSGSTLIACEQTGRNCYMMELDPHYIDVIIKRWENLTGKKAVLMNED